MKTKIKNVLTRVFGYLYSLEKKKHGHNLNDNLFSTVVNSL